MEYTKIKTSVIIPVYNTKEYLHICVKSALAQTQKEIEIILVDDGSTDGSREIVHDYEERYPAVKAIYQKNQKQGAARNAGMKAACGKYVYFLDSDDYIDKDLLEECYHTAEENRLDFVMFDAESFIDKEEKSLKQIALEKTYDRKNIGIKEEIHDGIGFWNQYYQDGGIYFSSCLVYVNADFLRRNTLFFEPGIYYEDNDWILRMYLYAQRISYIPRQLYHRRIREGSTVTLSWNNDHVKSSVVGCQRVLQLLVNEREERRQNMIRSLMLEIFSRLERFLESYLKDGRIKDIWQDVFAFYCYLLEIYKQMMVLDLAFDIISRARTIKSYLKKADNGIEIPEDDFEDYKKRHLATEFLNYPLNNKEATIGVYGTGKICRKFFSLYRQTIGEPLANIFFIDTYSESGQTYEGYPLCNLRDISGRAVDYIMIASSRYRTEMMKNVRMYLSGEVKILFMPELLKFF
jgi:glycosyltransferase involved in cell wall biosynthesis